MQNNLLISGSILCFVSLIKGQAFDFAIERTYTTSGWPERQECWHWPAPRAGGLKPLVYRAQILAIGTNRNSHFLALAVSCARKAWRIWLYQAPAYFNDIQTLWYPGFASFNFKYFHTVQRRIAIFIRVHRSRWLFATTVVRSSVGALLLWVIACTAPFMFQLCPATRGMTNAFQPVCSFLFTWC